MGPDRWRNRATSPYIHPMATQEAPDLTTPTSSRPHWAQRHPRDVVRAAGLAEGAVEPLVVSPSPFRLVSDYQPAGDQPEAIRELVNGL
ncbi:MAG: hypothetical protein VCD33_17495, partial [Alphaproteobacteria bacterium]